MFDCTWKESRMLHGWISHFVPRMLVVGLLIALFFGARISTSQAQYGPIAAYSFDEGSGTVAHDSIGNHDGTISNATWTSGGKYGSALSFGSGAKAMVSIPDTADLDLTDHLTLEAWVYPNGLSNYAGLITKAENSGGYSGYLLTPKVSTGGPTGNVSSSGTIAGVTSPTTISTGVWTHLALTSDGTTLRLYINGNLAATASAIAAKATGANLEIGHDQLFGTYFNGLIDEVRIYNRSLEQSQIQSDRETPVQAPAPHEYTTTTLDTGLNAEKVSSVPITASGQETTIYSLPANSIKADEVLRANGNLEVTNSHSYAVTDAVRLVLGSDANDANGTVITPWTAATQTSDTPHLTLPIDGDYRATSELGNQYLKVVLKASSSSAGSGETLKVEPGYGRLSATRYTLAQGSISQPTHQIQPLVEPLSEQIESLPVDSTWRTVLTRKVNGVTAEDILDIASQLAVQNTSGTTVQLQAQLTQSAEPSGGGSSASASDSTTDQLTAEMASDRIVLGNALKIDPAKPYVNLRVRALPVSGFPSPKPLTITAGSAALNILRFVPSPGTPSANLGVGTRESNPYWTDLRDVTSIPFAVSGGSEKRVVAHAPIYSLRKGDVINARGMITGDLGGNEGAQVLTRLIIANSPTETTGETVGVFSGDNITKAEQVHTSVKEGTYVSPEASSSVKYLNFVVYASQASPSGSMGVTTAALTYTRSMPTEPFSANFEDGSVGQFFKDEHGPLSASTDVAREGTHSLLANLDFSTTFEEPNGNLHEMIIPPDFRAAGGYKGEDGWYGFSVYFPKEGFTLGPNDAHFDGKIDEVRIYNQPMSQAKIQEDENGNYGSGPSPVAAYSFNEGSGTIAHDSTGNHNGVINGATWTPSGKYGSALDFDGQDDEITIPDSPELDLTNSFTLEAWVNSNKLSRWSPVITKTASNFPSGYLLNAQIQEYPGYDIHTVSAGASVGPSGISIAEGNPLSTGEWSHLAVTSDGTNLRLYINGELVDTEPSKTAKETANDLQIGASNFSTGALLTIFAQWHATTEGSQELGCTGFPSGAISNPNSVPVNFFAREVKAGEYINPSKTETASVNGDYLGVTFEGGQISEDCTESLTPHQTYILAPLERDRWYDFVLHTKWTIDEAPSGSSNSEVWLNGEQILGSQTIPITLPSLSWRLNPEMHDSEADAYYGIYRHITASQPTAKLYMDALRHGNSYTEVAPGQ